MTPGLFALAIIIAAATATATTITTATYNPCGEDCSNDNCSNDTGVCVWGGAAAFQSKVENFRVLHNIKSSQVLQLATLENNTSGEQLVRHNGQSYSLKLLRSHSVLAKGFIGEGVIPRSPVSKATLPNGGQVLVIEDNMGNPDLIIIDDDTSIYHLFALDPVNHAGVFLHLGADDYDFDDLNSRFKFGHLNYTSNRTYLYSNFSSLNRTSLRRKLGSGRKLADDGWGAFGCTSNLKVIKVAVEADSSFCMKLGGVQNALLEVQRIVALASTIFQRNSLCLEVKICYVNIHCDAKKDPYASMSKDSGCGEEEKTGFLDDVQKHWNDKYVGSSAAMKSRHTAHVFTGNKWTGNVIGCAYTKSLCGLRSYGVENILFGYDRVLRAVLFAHELGHNSGSYHHKGDHNVMNPSIVSSTQFSFAAVASIQSYVGSVYVGSKRLRDYSSCYEGYDLKVRKAVGKVDGKYIVKLKPGQRVVSFYCGYDCCAYGPANSDWSVDGKKVIILDEGARVVSAAGSYQRWMGGELTHLWPQSKRPPRYGNVIVLLRGERVVSRSADFKEYEGGVVDGYNVAIMPSGYLAVFRGSDCDREWRYNIDPQTTLVFIDGRKRRPCLGGAKQQDQGTQLMPQPNNQSANNQSATGQPTNQSATDQSGTNQPNQQPTEPTERDNAITHALLVGTAVSSAFLITLV